MGDNFIPARASSRVGHDWRSHIVLEVTPLGKEQLLFISVTSQPSGVSTLWWQYHLLAYEPGWLTYVGELLPISGWYYTGLMSLVAPWGWPSRGGAVLYRLSPQLGEDPPCWGPGVMWSSGGTGVAQLVACSTLDQCVVGSSPICGTEHFGFPPSVPRLGNQRPWYVQPRLCDWAYKRSRATYRKEKGIVSRWSVSS